MLPHLKILSSKHSKVSIESNDDRTFKTGLSWIEKNYKAKQGTDKLNYSINIGTYIKSTLSIRR